MTAACLYLRALPTYVFPSSPPCTASPLIVLSSSRSAVSWGGIGSITASYSTLRRCPIASNQAVLSSDDECGLSMGYLHATDVAGPSKSPFTPPTAPEYQPHVKIQSQHPATKEARAATSVFFLN